MHHPLIIAHRSLTPGGLESSVTGLLLAAEAGADLIELDVRLTLDRTPVILHDALLGRTTNAHGPIRLMPSFALSRLTLRQADGTEHIPTLRDVIVSAPNGVQLALHLKSRDAVGPVLRVIHRFGTPGRTWMWLDCVDDAYRATRELPELRCTLLRPAAWIGSRRDVYFRDAQACGARAVCVPGGAVSPELVHHAHQHHLAVFSRIDNIDSLPALVSKGLDGVITTDPARAGYLVRHSYNL